MTENRKQKIENRGEKGIALILTFIVMVTLTAIVVSFLFLISIQTKGSGYDIASHKALWLAEAGLSKAIWKLMTAPSNGGQGENWTTAGTTENLADGNYTMVVSRYDFALASNGASASDSPAQTDPTIGPAKAIDNDNSTYWQSIGKPKDNEPQNLIIAFPYPININKVRFISPSPATRPRDYKWYVSTNDNFTNPAVYEVQNNSADCTTREDVFTTQTNISYLKLEVTQGVGSESVQISTLEVLGSKVTPTGTVNSISRKVSQTAAVLDGATTHACFDGTLPAAQAYTQRDWTEVAP